MFLQDSSTALHEASDSGHAAVVSLLLDHKADVHAVGREVGDTYVVDLRNCFMLTQVCRDSVSLAC